MRSRLRDVEAAAQKYFKENQLNLAIIGNFDDRQRFEKLLKFYILWNKHS